MRISSERKTNKILPKDRKKEFKVFLDKANQRIIALRQSPKYKRFQQYRRDARSFDSTESIISRVESDENKVDSNDYMECCNVYGEVEKLEALRDRDWQHYIMIHDSNNIMSGFIAFETFLDDKDYFYFLGQSVVLTNTLWQYRDAVLESMKGRDKSAAVYMMSRQERAYLKSLPDILTIYRACKKSNQAGLSWTLSHDTAKFFTLHMKAGSLIDNVFQTIRSGASVAGRSRYNKLKSFILHGQCRKQDIIAYLNNRDEDEILIDPQYVTSLKKDYVK